MPTIVILAPPDYRWPLVGERVRAMPPSRSGSIADLVRPNQERGEVIHEDPGSKPRLAFTQAYDILTVTPLAVPGYSVACAQVEMQP